MAILDDENLRRELLFFFCRGERGSVRLRCHGVGVGVETKHRWGVGETRIPIILVAPSLIKGRTGCRVPQLHSRVRCRAFFGVNDLRPKIP
jgi:hypothetical protein